MGDREREKQEREEEKKEIEKLLQLIREDEMNKLKQTHERRQQLKKELEDQIAISNGFLNERNRQEAELDRMFNAMVEAEIAKEKSDIKETSEALRKEMLAYLAYLRELREEEARREVETDALIREFNKQALAKQRLFKKKEEETRKRNLMELIRVREEQMRERREAEERERKRYEEEKIRVEQELERDAKLTEEENRKRFEESLLYKKDLVDQMKYIEERRKRDKEESERLYNDGLRREREFEQLMNEVLEQTEKTKNLHPNTMVIKQYFERRKAELK